MDDQPAHLVTLCAGAYEILLLSYGDKEHIVFTGFRAADLTSALALLEHLTAQG